VLDNQLLREPLRLEHIKLRLLGHWGTTPGLNFIFVHFNRLIRTRDLNVICVADPGHAGPGLVANTYLEGPTARSIRTSVETMKDCGACLGSSRSRASGLRQMIDERLHHLTYTREVRGRRNRRARLDPQFSPRA
jgi:XFP-like protein